MDPWIGNNEEDVRELVDRITASVSRDGAPPERELYIGQAGNLSNEEWGVITKAIKRNSTLEKLIIDFLETDAELKATPALLIADALQSHATLKELSFNAAQSLEMNAIALAIKSNPIICQISFDHCHLSRDIVENLAFVMKEDALESLEINQGVNRLGNFSLMDISGLFGPNQSLKKLVITNENSDGVAMSSATLRDLARTLRENQGLEKLELHLDGLEHPSDFISDMARAAASHRCLTKLTLAYSTGEFDTNAAEALGDMLERTPSLEELDLEHCRIGDEGALHLARGLRSENCRLKSLGMFQNNVGDIGASAIATALRHSTVETLDLSKNNLGSECAVSIATLLSVNATLRRLHMSTNPIGGNGPSVIARALESNRTLECLSIGNCGQEGLKAVISNIPLMHGLRSLSISVTKSVNSENASALLKAIERNTELISFSICGKGEQNPCLTKVLPQVYRLVGLNRAGRRILKSERAVPRSLWPRILGRPSGNTPEAIYFFLRENPQLFMKPQTALGKRKRDYSSCVIS